MWKDTSSVTSPALKRILGIVVSLSAISLVLESVAGVGGRSRLIDLTGVLIERPLWLLIFGVWLVFVLARFSTRSWATATALVLRYAPLYLCVPLVNDLVSWLGLESTAPTFVNILEAPVSLLTLGWLPRFLASPGVLVGLLVAAIVLALELKRLNVSPKRILFIAILWLFGSLVLLLLPSLVSWIVVSSSVSPLNAGPNVLARAWIALSQEGYWWRSIIDRFPGILEGEAEASVRLLQLALVWLIGLGVLIGIGIRRRVLSWRQWMSWFKPVRGLSLLASAFFGMWVGALIGGGAIVLRAVDILAVVLFITLLLGVWIFSVWRNDLHDLPQDRELGRVDRPLVNGQLSLEEYARYGMGAAAVFLVGGWLLGWPVLLPCLVFLVLQEGLASPLLRWKDRWYGLVPLALSWLMLALSGVFFAVRSASVPLLHPMIWLAIAAFVFLQAVPRAMRWSPQTFTKLAGFFRLSPRMLIPIALALSYLLVPLLAGWVIVWWIAIPSAVVALLPLLGNGRWDERKMVGWQTAFILIAFFLLSVRPSP